MDRVSYFGTVFCLIGMMAYFFFIEAYYPTGLLGNHKLPKTVGLSPGITGPAVLSNNSNGSIAPQVQDFKLGDLSVLENSVVKASFNPVGGSIQQVLLKDHFEEGKPIVLNGDGWSGMMAQRGWLPQTGDLPKFTQKSLDATTIVYDTTLPSQLDWQRTMSLEKDGYVISITDKLTNPTSKGISLPEYNICLGRSRVLHTIGSFRISDIYLGASFWGEPTGFFGYKFGIISIGSFNPSKTLGIFPVRGVREEVSNEDVIHPPLKWVAAQDQFYAQLLVPAIPASKALVRCYNGRDSYGNIPYGVKDPDPELETFALFPGVGVSPGTPVELKYEFYAGPKDWDLLSKLGPTVAEIMNYGYFALLILPMRYFLHVFFHIWGSYGLAIMSLTLLMKGLTWPIQEYTFKAGKKMQALAPMLKELQTKYKDQPDRILAEQGKLYGEYGASPFSSCWTVFIQGPVFFSLYFMLQTAVELRNTPFLWVKDLTQPDALFSFYIGDFHVVFNLLPILVTATMMAMMRLTPMPGADPVQAKVLQFMPLFYLYIFYQFAAALSLYYVINNSVAMFQVWRNSKRPVPVLVRRIKPAAR